MAQKPQSVSDLEPGSGCGPLLLFIAALIFAGILLFATPTGGSRSGRLLAAIQSVKIGNVPVLAIALSVFAMWQAFDFMRKKMVRGDGARLSGSDE